MNVKEWLRSERFEKWLWVMGIINAVILLLFVLLFIEVRKQPMYLGNLGSLPLRVVWINRLFEITVPFYWIAQLTSFFFGIGGLFGWKARPTKAKIGTILNLGVFLILFSITTGLSLIVATSFFSPS